MGYLCSNGLYCNMFVWDAITLNTVLLYGLTTLQYLQYNHVTKVSGTLRKGNRPFMNPLRLFELE